MAYQDIITKNNRQNMAITLKRESKEAKPFANKINRAFTIIIFIYMIINTMAIMSNPGRILLSQYSYITVTINEMGNQSFLSSSFKLCPDEVYVNDIKVEGEVCKKTALSEETNRIKIVFQNEINSTFYMFYRLFNIKEIDLSHFNSSLVTNMKYMFSYCYRLTSIDFTNIDTSSVTSMEFMFQRCLSLSSIDLSGFNTSKVTSMKDMFNTCRYLASLDFSSFDTSSVQNMDSMFWNCSRLTSLNLEKFDTSQVTSMNEMFHYGKFTYLNLSNFNTSNVKIMSSMFASCSKLESLDISSFNTSHKLKRKL